MYSRVAGDQSPAYMPHEPGIHGSRNAAQHFAIKSCSFQDLSRPQSSRKVPRHTKEQRLRSQLNRPDSNILDMFPPRLSIVDYIPHKCLVRL
jgi:hypothetical protein